jgi:hypothetical protein
MPLAGDVDVMTLTRCKKKNGGFDAAALYLLRSIYGVMSLAHDFV